MQRSAYYFIFKFISAVLTLASVELLVTCLPVNAQAAPLQWKQQSPLSVALFVNASINGRERTFLLDTGLHKTILAPDEQTKALASNGQAWMMSSAGESKPCDLVKLKKFMFDGENQPDSEAQRCDFGASSANTLGMSSLGQHILSLNFSRGEYSVRTTPECELPLAMTRSSQGHMMLPVEVAGEKVRALFDTGWSITAVDLALIKAHPEAFTAVPIQGDMKDLTGGSTQVSYYRVKNLKIGNVNLKNQIVGSYLFNASLKAVLGDDTRVIIGSNTMVLADWSFNLKRNLWSIVVRPQAVAQN